MTSTANQDMVAAATALRPQIVAARDCIERSQHLPPDLVSAMNDAGLFRIFVSPSRGGPGTDPVTAFRAVEQISASDGSVGWCSFIASSISLFMGWLDAAVARDMFGFPCNLRCAGSFRAMGTARVTGGGYVVAGQWDFASGCHHANWLFLNCVVCGDDGPRFNADGLPQLRMMSVPIEEGQIIDNWDVVGLRGSGSNDVAVSDVFVPDNRTFSIADQPLSTEPLCTFRTAMPVIYTLLAANTLGMARGAMDAFLELAGARATTMNTTLLRDRAPVQEVVGLAEAVISGARAYVLDAVGNLWEGVLSREEDLGGRVLQARLSITHAVHESARAIDLLYHSSGTNAVRRSNLLERYFRDVHAARMHLGGLLTNFEQGGRVALGLPPGAPGW